jgi:ssDNA-binding Zn-finger/Zn-ribbon topoisomerase 1
MSKKKQEKNMIAIIETKSRSEKRSPLKKRVCPSCLSRYRVKHVCHGDMYGLACNNPECEKYQVVFGLSETPEGAIEAWNRMSKRFDRRYGWLFE